MTGSEDWARLKTIFGDALPLAGAARSAYLDDACSDDPVLRADVERLLDAHDRAGTFLETSAGTLPNRGDSDADALIGSTLESYTIRRSRSSISDWRS